jgi:hypothetical protein
MNALIVIYGPNLKRSGGASEGIEIYNVFDRGGLIDESTLSDLFEDICKGQITSLSPGNIGYFADGHQLQRFCFMLCQKLSHKGVSLMTAQQYNSVLEKSHTAEELGEKLAEAGDFIENVDAEKKGFFDELFSSLKRD